MTHTKKKEEKEEKKKKKKEKKKELDATRVLPHGNHPVPTNQSTFSQLVGHDRYRPHQKVPAIWKGHVEFPSSGRPVTNMLAVAHMVAAISNGLADSG